METGNMSKISKDHLYTNYRLNMLIGETVDRVNLLNALEEPSLCLRCDYCNFLKSLRIYYKKMVFLLSILPLVIGKFNILKIMF